MVAEQHSVSRDRVGRELREVAGQVQHLVRAKSQREIGGVGHPDRSGIIERIGP